MQEATADGTTTGSLESTGDSLVRLSPTPGAPFTSLPKVLPPPSPDTAIMPNGIRLLKSILRLQTVNCSPTRHGNGGLPTGQPLCCLQQTLSQDQQSRSQAELRFFPKKKRSRAVEVGDNLSFEAVLTRPHASQHALTLKEPGNPSWLGVVILGDSTRMASC